MTRRDATCRDAARPRRVVQNYDAADAPYYRVTLEPRSSLVDVGLH